MKTTRAWRGLRPRHIGGLGKRAVVMCALRTFIKVIAGLAGASTLSCFILLPQGRAAAAQNAGDADAMAEDNQ